MIDKINQLKAEIEAVTAANIDEVEALRIKYLSKKGAITSLMQDFRTVPAEQKRELGQKLNELKTIATERLAALREALENSDTVDSDLDLTRTAAPLPLGSRHPLSLVKDEIIAIFSRLGFTIAEGPEIEDDWHVFSSLNFAEDHPARDMQDTFFISAVTSNGEQPASDTHHLPRTSVPQRSYLGTCALLLPSGGSSVCRRERVVCRPSTDTPLLRS